MRQRIDHGWRNVRRRGGKLHRTEVARLREVYEQERKLQTFLHLAVWLGEGESLDQPIWTGEGEKPELWKVLDRIDQETEKAIYPNRRKRWTQTDLDQLLADDSELIGLEWVDTIDEILDCIPPIYHTLIAEAYYEQIPLPKDLAEIIAEHLQDTKIDLPNAWYKAIRMAEKIHV
jgi:hypothetical protein